MRASEIITNVLHRLEEDPAAPVFWSREELLGFLNEGNVELVLISGYLTSERPQQLIGAKVQSVPPDAITLLGVQYCTSNIFSITSSCPTVQPELGVPYSYTFEAFGGTPPYTWSIVSGALPGGLTLNAATGEISGTPTESGTFSYTIQVSDSSSFSCSALSVLMSCEFFISNLFIVSCPTEQPEIDVPYSYTFEATGGTPPYTWELVSGPLPDGLNLDDSTGEVSGTPTESGTFPYTVGVTDSSAPSHSAQIDCEFEIPGFLYYSDFIVRTGNVPSTQTNFTVGITWTDDRFKHVSFGGHVESLTGDDLRPYDPTGVTPRTFEKVWYNPSAGSFEMWILMSTIDDADVIRMKYGNTSITTDGTSTATWPSEYSGVWHYGSPTSLALEDSTSNGNDGTGVNAPTVTTGPFGGGAVSLAIASAQSVNVPDSPELEVTKTTPMTWEFWVKRSGNPTNPQIILDKRKLVTAQTGWIIYLTGGNPDIMTIAIIHDSPNQIADSFLGKIVIAGDWEYYVITYDGSGSNTGLTIHQPNSVSQLQNRTNGPLSGATESDGNFSVGQADFDGAVDEVRISKGVVRAQNYGITAYNNQSLMTGFWTLDAEVTI